MIRAKFHKIGGEVLLAACDCEIFGKVIEDAEIVLNLSGSFYDGPEVDEDEFSNMLAQATSANLVGRKVVEIAIRQNEVEPANVREVAGVPHALLFYM
jgi:hypothetical protein